MINILIRTSNRPLYLLHCIKSIQKQTCKDYRIIVGNDSQELYHFMDVHYERAESNGTYMVLPNKIKAMHFPVNLYLNKLMAEVKQGWVMILDDDDMFADKNAIKKILAKCTDPTKAVFWKVAIGDRVVPSKFGRPKVKDISMIGFCFHSNYIPVLQFDCYKQTDYRVADRIYSILDVVYIDEILTKTQDSGDGFGKRKDKKR